MGASTFIDRGACPLCGEARRLPHIAFPDIPVVRCAGCGFLHSACVLGEEALAAYYAEGFGGLRHQLGQSVNATINAAVLPRLLALSPGERVLDVGAGYGYLLDRLQQRHGVIGVGVEPSHQEAAFARNALGVQVIAAMLADAGLDKAGFDLVASFEVIEHVARPVDFIRELAAYVKPGGRLLVMTDNFESGVVRSLGAAFPKWIPHTHISHFGPETLARALRAAGGLEIETSMSYTPWEFLARDGLRRLRDQTVTPEQAFDLKRALASEMGGRYRLYGLRKLLNAAWASATIGPAMDGAVMYFVCRKPG
ncbi:Methyltransferase type 11 [Rubrivivax sp. A210]|uniref:class I SAM-dependent methyltransferase n=1 Tax=Rubrivivax sp. A210 TaxID=2772301 RepID=UPI001918906E|nr:class I SAM-dependent methyltransferase [Rubrivivax sp. A210]CAD5369176.1 Methyltransferase type 11 [Rubrivivax sp. A210]